MNFGKAFATQKTVQEAQAVSDGVVDKFHVFEDLLRKIIRMMPEHSTDMKYAVDAQRDTIYDLLSKIKKQLRMLRIEYKPEEKEEMVELSTSSAEASGEEDSEVFVAPTITPRQKRGIKPNVSGSTTSSSSSSSARPPLSSTRLGSRRANEMIQQATH